MTSHAGVRSSMGAVVEEAGADRESTFDLEAVYRHHYVATVRLAGLLLGDPATGEDVAQDAFARLFEVGTEVVDPVAYLRGTVVKLCRSRIRRAVIASRARPHRRVSLPDDDRAELIASRSALRTTLLGLPPRQREAVVLRYYGDLPESDIASVMGVSVGSVKTHLHRAMAALARDLEAFR